MIRSIPIAAIVVAALIAAESPVQAQATASQTSADSIVGVRQAGGAALGYYPGTTNTVIGTGGASGSRINTNVVLGFSLPTLAAGQKLNSVDLNFEITAARNHDGGDIPMLDAYLLDTANPDGTADAFFFHGDSDPSGSVEFIGRTSTGGLTSTTDEVPYPADSEDRTYSFSGGALDLIKTYYGGDHIPDQTEAFFRFNLNVLTDINAGTAFVRYRVDLDPSESDLQIGTVSVNNLFNDDFEIYTPDTSLNTSGPWGAFGSSTKIVVRDETTATPFGTPNQYMQWNDDDNSSVRAQSDDIAGASNAVTTFSFDFVETSTGGSDSLLVGYAMEGQDLTSAGQRLSIHLDDGAVTGLSTTADNAYDLDTKYRLYIIFNDTDSAFDYGLGEVAAGEADIWIEDMLGELTFVGTRAEFNAETASYRLGFRSFSSALQEVLIDNVSLDLGVTLPTVIPTPAALPAGLALLGVACLRRRR